MARESQVGHPWSIGTENINNLYGGVSELWKFPLQGLPMLTGYLLVYLENYFIWDLPTKGLEFNRKSLAPRIAGGWVKR